MAVAVKSTAIVEMLIQHGADVNAVDINNKTPLKAAIDSDASEIAKALRKANAKY